MAITIQSGAHTVERDDHAEPHQSLESNATTIKCEAKKSPLKEQVVDTFARAMVQPSRLLTKRLDPETDSLLARSKYDCFLFNVQNDLT